MKLWYEQPAKKWEEALPIGNGRLGAMVSGGSMYEMIWLNEDSVWSGKPLDRINPDAAKYLPEIRRLLRAGKIAEAEKLTMLALSGIPNSERSYETAGEMVLEFDHREPVSRYYRELDLETGVASVSYETGGTCYTRKMIASYPDQAMILHLEAEGEGKLDFTCRLGRCRNRLDAVHAESGSIRFLVDGGAGISFQASLLAEQEGGKMSAIGEHLVVKDAVSATLYLNIVTSFREQEYERICTEQLKRAAKKGWNACLSDHIRDYKQIFGRLTLALGKDEARETLPTDQRLEALKKGEEDAGLFALYFQYGRYLLLSSSRGDCLPANLQGIWNESLTPPWDSKFTININTEMNYWVAESGNLSECHFPYFTHLKRVMENGKETARRMYGCRGSVAHHNVDIYGDTAPQDHCISATFWVMGEAWLATHIWEHYLYTGDAAFLEEYFEVLQESVTFFYDFLIEGPDNTLVTSPSLSPENTYIRENGIRGCLCEGPAMDNEILWELLQGYIGACRVLGKDASLIREAEKVRDRLPAIKIGKHGQIQEWMEDYDEAEPGHRHISQLYGVYPGSSITWNETPELMQAARTTLERRLTYGGGHTGWSRAWIIGLWAKFLDGEKAYENFRALLTDSTFPNLMDNHPMMDGFVFQIDGNLGAAAALLEMLVQCRDGYIRLLPALPAQFGEGKVKGIVLRGGITLSMEWREQRIVWLELVSGTDQKVVLERNGIRKEVSLQAGVVWQDGEISV